MSACNARRWTINWNPNNYDNNTLPFILNSAQMFVDGRLGAPVKTGGVTVGPYANIETTLLNNAWDAVANVSYAEFVSTLTSKNGLLARTLAANADLAKNYVYKGGLNLTPLTIGGVLPCPSASYVNMTQARCINQWSC